MDQFKQAVENNLINVLEILSVELKQRFNVDVSTSELINMLNKDSSNGKSLSTKRSISVNSRPSPSIAKSSTTNTSTRSTVDDSNKCIAIVEKTKERCAHPINNKTSECQAQKLCGMHFKVWNNDPSKLKTINDRSSAPAASNKSTSKLTVSIPRGRVVAVSNNSSKSTKIMVNEETDIDFEAREMEDYPGYFITEQDLIYTKLSNGDRGLVGKVVQDEYIAIPPKEASVYRASGWVILDLDNPDDIFGSYKVNNGNKINVTPSAKANGVANGTGAKLGIKSGVSRVIKPISTKVVEEDPVDEQEDEQEDEPPKPVPRAVPKTAIKVAIGPRPSAVKTPIPVAAPKNTVVILPSGKKGIVVPKSAPKPTPVVEEPVVVEEEVAEESQEAQEEQVEESQEEQQDGDAEDNEEAQEEQVEESEQADE